MKWTTSNSVMQMSEVVVISVIIPMLEGRNCELLRLIGAINFFIRFDEM